MPVPRAEGGDGNYRPYHPSFVGQGAWLSWPFTRSPPPQAQLLHKNNRAPAPGVGVASGKGPRYGYRGSNPPTISWGCRRSPLLSSAGHGASSVLVGLGAPAPTEEKVSLCPRCGEEGRGGGKSLPAPAGPALPCLPLGVALVCGRRGGLCLAPAGDLGVFPNRRSHSLQPAVHLLLEREIGHIDYIWKRGD